MAEEKYPYSVNPFDLLKFDEFLTKYADTIISTENKKFSSITESLTTIQFICALLKMYSQIWKNKEIL